MGNAGAEFWVFAYGSLMWKPGFAHAERLRARLDGYVRRFCLDSITYRGTPEFPGLVLALDEAAGGACDGVAYRVPPAEAEATRAYLRARELVTYSYLERELPATLEDGRKVTALAYVMDHSHPQYRGGLSPREQAAVIARAVGPAGSNVEYLENTVAHLAGLGIEDGEMTRLLALVRALAAEPTG